MVSTGELDFREIYRSKIIKSIFRGNGKNTVFSHRYL